MQWDLVNISHLQRNLTVKTESCNGSLSRKYYELNWEIYFVQLKYRETGGLDYGRKKHRNCSNQR